MNHEQAAQRIPDLVTGRLGDDERRLVEAHVAECEACRISRAHADQLHEFLETESIDSLTAHVQAQHLASFVDAPAELEPTLRGWIETHLEECSACSDAVACMRSPSGSTTPSAATPRPRTDTGSKSKGPWNWLGRTLLHPVPAAAYLILFAITAGLWGPWRTTVPTDEPGGPIAGLLPPPVAVYPAEQFRGGETDAPEPARVGDPAGDLQLQFHTELDDELLDDPTIALRFELHVDGRPILARDIAPDEISPYGVLSLLVPRGSLARGATGRARLTRGDALLFERDLLFLPR